LKKVFCVLIALMIMISDTCFAGSVGDSEISLGGISVNSTASYIRSVYGEPTKIRDEYNGEEDIWERVWYYGRDVKIYFHDSDRSTVSHVIVTANNGFSTPAGVYVGMRESALEEVYGAPMTPKSYNHGYTDKNGIWHSHSYYRSASNMTTGILIEAANGKIVKINIGDGFQVHGYYYEK